MSIINIINVDNYSLLYCKTLPKNIKVFRQKIKLKKAVLELSKTALNL